MAVHVRRIRSDEGTRLRAARLAALADAPLAFASTFDEESRRPDEAWALDAATRSRGRTSATFLAEDRGTLGLVGAYRDQEDQETVELVSTWVAPEARGRGVGALLVERVLKWARAGGATRVGLWVTRGNAPAIALYRAAGFLPTGAEAPHPWHPCHDELRMAQDSDARGRLHGHASRRRSAVAVGCAAGVSARRGAASVDDV